MNTEILILDDVYTAGMGGGVPPGRRRLQKLRATFSREFMDGFKKQVRRCARAREG